MEYASTVKHGKVIILSLQIRNTCKQQVLSVNLQAQKKEPE